MKEREREIGSKADWVEEAQNTKEKGRKLETHIRPLFANATLQRGKPREPPFRLLYNKEGARRGIK